MNAMACTICQKPGHHCRNCPELAAPLRPGFFAPSGGGGHSHDDDDEKAKKVIPHPVLQILRIVTTVLI